MDDAGDNRRRIPHSDDDKEYPDILWRFNILCTKVDAANLMTKPQNGVLYSDVNLPDVMEKMELLLDNICQLGYEGFLLPLKTNALMEMADNGSTIVVNTSSIIDPGVALIIHYGSFKV